MNIGRPRQFSEEFRQQVLALRRSGMSIVEVGLQLDIDKRTVVYLTPPEFLEGERKKVQVRKDAVVALARKGLMQFEIADSLSEDRALVHRWLKEAGISVELSVTQLTPEQEASFAADYRSGLTRLEMASKYGLTEGGIKGVIKRLGCRLTPEQFTERLSRGGKNSFPVRFKRGTVNYQWHSKESIAKRVISRSNRNARRHGFETLQERCEAWAAAKGGACRGVVSFTQDASWGCKNGHEWQALPKNVLINGTWCPRCADTGPSGGQLEVYEYIKSLLPGVEVILGDRSTIINPKTGRHLELDVYIPSRQFAMEYNGLIWHSSKYMTDPAKHQTKALECRKQNIRLLSIFSDEWLDPVKNELIRGMIRHRLGVLGTKLRASKLELKRLDKNAQFKDFFDRNHLDGHVKARYAYGLFREGKLVSCMSIRTNHRAETEIARFATDYDFHVHGGAGRLVKAVLSEVGGLVTFSNNRLSNGDVYRKLGAKLLQENGASYWYTDNIKRIWRFRCRRLNDPAILAKYPEVPHTENDQALGGVFSMEILGFGDRRPLYRIPDAGHRKWLFTPTK